jgi:hypothetical protein
MGAIKTNGSNQNQWAQSKPMGTIKTKRPKQDIQSRIHVLYTPEDNLTFKDNYIIY